MVPNPVLDAAVIMVGLRLDHMDVGAGCIFKIPTIFPVYPFVWHHSLYTAFWISTMYLGGAYDHYFSKERSSAKVLIVGTIFSICLLQYDAKFLETISSRAACWGVFGP